MDGTQAAAPHGLSSRPKKRPHLKAGLVLTFSPSSSTPVAPVTPDRSLPSWAPMKPVSGHAAFAATSQPGNQRSSDVTFSPDESVAAASKRSRIPASCKRKPTPPTAPGAIPAPRPRLVQLDATSTAPPLLENDPAGALA